MSHYLQEQIATRRSRLASLDTERARLIAELSAYEDALANAADGAGPVTILTTRKQRQRLLPVSKAWRAILQRLAGFKHFNADDVKLEAQKLYDEGILKKPQTNDGVRAQLSLYAKRGIVKRRGIGSYLLTEQTKNALSLPSFATRDTNQAAKLAWARVGDSGPGHGG